MIASPRVSSLGLIALGGLVLLAGLWAGLIRIGWSLPPLQPDLALVHGPLMVDGFLGLVVGLERSVALGQRWSLGAPVLAGLGGLALLVGVPTSVAAALFVGSGLFLVVIFGLIYRLRQEPSSVLLAAGALTWLVGNLLWLRGDAIVLVTPWWAGFLVLTIAGERLELAQVLLPFRSRLLLLVSAGLLLVGLVVSVASYTSGVQLAGLGLLLMAGWLLHADVARRSLRRGGLARFGGSALLVGYVWLGFGGLLWLLGPERLAEGSFWYDAMLHSIFLGFVFSMILGHAPTIISAVTGIRVPFTRWFYAPLVLLHASLVLRMVGDLWVAPEARLWGGLLNATAILLFALFTLGASRRGRSRR